MLAFIQRTVLIAAFAGALAATSPLQAQFRSPDITGNPTSPFGKYGDMGEGQNTINTMFGQAWYMTWDDTNLYIGLTNASLSEAAVVYIDCDPIIPVDGGSNANGSLVGQLYDNTNFAQLPFRADFVVYFKSGYHEFRRRNGFGGWTDSIANSLNYAESNAQGTREIAIAWNAVTGGEGRPAAFNWFGYATSQQGFVYGAVPIVRLGGNIQTDAREPWYHTVDSTGNGASTHPFSLVSYTFVNRFDEAIVAPELLVGSFADFTMNRPGRRAHRSESAPFLPVRDLVVGAGEFDLHSDARPLEVNRDVLIVGGTLTLGSVPLGDLKVHRDLRIEPGAAFACKNRQVEFLGPANCAIKGDFTGTNRIDFLRLNKSGLRIIDLDGDLEIGSRLWMSNGILQANGNSVTVQWPGQDSADTGVRRSPTENGYVRGAIRRVIGTSSGTRQFPVGTNPAAPLFIDFGFPGPSQSAIVTVSTAQGITPPFTADNMIARMWHVNVDGALGAYSAQLRFRYDPADVTGTINPAQLRAAKQFNPTSFHPHASIWNDPDPIVQTANFSVSNTRDSLNLEGMWILTSAPDAVLRVDLLSFTASTNGIGAPVILEWETAAEFMNAGFNIYRLGEMGQHRRVNAFPIPAQGSEFAGAAYSFTDLEGLQPGEVRGYLLEDVEFSGARALHGPVAIGPLEASFSAVESWPLFGQ